MNLAALALSGLLLVNGAGGPPTIPPAPERCMNVGQAHGVAAQRDDTVVLDSSDPYVIRPFADRYNEQVPVTAFEFEHVMVIKSPNPGVTVMLVLLFYAEGPAKGCAALMPVPQGEAARLYLEGKGRGA